MCQCLICGCWWYNYCGVCCGGCHEASLFYSWWLCKPEDLRMLDPECCHICACDGLGGNCLYYGSICCAPKAVQEWSGLRAAGKTAGDLSSGKTIIINNTSPPPIYMQPANGNFQMTTTTTRNYPGVNMNVNMGGMEMNSNMGGMGMNTNMNVGMGVNGNMGGVEMNTNMGGMGMNTNMNVGMNGGMGMNANVNMGNPNMNMNANYGAPGVNAKISF
jgi:hypothetical protein